MAASAQLPTRVLMTADTVGGVFVYALELMRALETAGVEVALATMGALPSPAQREALASLRNVELFESDWKLEWMDDPWEHVQRAGDWLLDVEAKTAPDVVHLNGYVHAALDWYAPCITVAHSCMLSWWSAVRRSPIPDGLASYRQHVWRGLRAARVVVAPSHAMRVALDEHYGALTTTRVIANAIERRAFAPGSKLPYVFAAGRVWDEAKNLRVLGKVAPRLEWPVVVAGATSSPDERSLTLAGVHSLGVLPRQDLAEWLSRGSIYAHPARYEPFGLSVLEAASAGCALVLGDIPSLRENWDGAAVFVDPDDERALERALAYLIAEPERREELARAALRNARNFHPARMRDAYLAVYQEVMAQRRKVLEENAACTS
jgi:glycosyltransferase involved in cell wall biosynthesis